MTGVIHLRPTVDYDIDYLQGRILLTEPLSSTVADQLLVRSDGLSGDEAWLVAQYEFTPGFDEIDSLAAGGTGHLWLTDWLQLGLTGNRNNNEDEDDSSLYGGDVTARLSTESWAKVQAGRSEGLVTSTFRSDDGGFLFAGITATGARGGRCQRLPRGRELRRRGLHRRRPRAARALRSDCSKRAIPARA